MHEIKCSPNIMKRNNPGYGIDTVHERGQGAYNFGQYYDSLCALQNTVPVNCVKAQLDKNILDINADKIRLNDWPAILKAVQINKSLVKIGIHSFYNDASISLERSSELARTPLTASTGKHKVPPVHSKDLTYQLCKSLKDCLLNSDCLEFLQIEGLPLRQRDVSLISKGVAKSFKLCEISLESSHIGDSLQVLCDGIKNASTINWLNLSGCSLVDGALEAISRVARHQAIMRHSEAWKSSLRYRAPDLDCMPGLRRITLNNNPLLGDKAAEAMADALKDDLWLKAVDLQRCGITDQGAEILLNALRLNSTLVILDVRNNHLITKLMIDRIIQQLVINGDSKSSRYEWLPLNAAKIKRDAFTLKRRHTPSKPPKPVAKSPDTKIVIHKTKTTPCSTRSPTTPKSVPKQRGLPWRTAERASIHRIFDESDKLDGQHIQTQMSRTQELPTAEANYRSSVYLHVDRSEGDTISQDLDTELGQAPAKYAMDREALILIKELQAENVSLKRRLHEEAVARAAAEDRALELARDNRRLQSDIRQIGDGIVPSRPPTQNGADEELLNQVETAFQKFNMFLDLVRDTGMGHLIAEAGLSHYANASSPIPYPDPTGVPTGHPISRGGAAYHSAIRAGDPSFIEPSGTQPELASFTDYLIGKPVRSVSTDIIPHADPHDPPRKTYSEHMTGSKTLARVAAQQPTRQEADADQALASGKPNGVDDGTKLIGIKTFGLKDISELETPKFTPPISPRPSNEASLNPPQVQVSAGEAGPLKDGVSSPADEVPEEPVIDVKKSVNTETVADNYSSSFTAMSSQSYRTSSKEGEENALSPDALSLDALSPDALTPDALSPDALSPDALSPEPTLTQSGDYVSTGINNIKSLSQLDSDESRTNSSF